MTSRPSTRPTPPLDMAGARTLPTAAYVDPAALEAEKARIFGRTWQLVAHVSDLLRPGDFVSVTVLDQPVVVVRGLDGELRGFYSVPRHRAGQVALSRGNRTSLQCRHQCSIHGLDGSLRACPGLGGTRDSDKADFGLVPVRVDRFGPFVCVKLDPGTTRLAEVTGDIPGEVAAAGFHIDAMTRVERRDCVVEADWKVHVDDYLEGYHIRSPTRRSSARSTTTPTGWARSASTRSSPRRSAT